MGQTCTASVSSGEFALLQTLFVSIKLSSVHVSHLASTTSVCRDERMMIGSLLQRDKI